MSEIIPLSGPDHLPPGQTMRLGILLHGYGADGHNLIDLAPFFAEAMPGTAFFAPHAPHPCEVNPAGRQWFSLADYDPEQVRNDPSQMGPIHQAMLAGAQQAAPSLNGFIDDLLQRYGATPRHLALIGFSQGTMMALHVALRRPEPIAGILGFSGALLGAQSLPGEIAARPPVMLVHGEDDPLIPVQALGIAETGLKAAGVPVETLSRPGLPHGIDEVGATEGARFLQRCFGIQSGA